ncbi:HAD-IA family hydrolase [Thiomicrorhabdus sp.]|uniref:HAD family hydrolase n=1 Tax=Thiomicrorhabdus sp. TaxID=2039724 RepID=UPI0029C69D34|nr:HAD-IA family hydrolase [Thiomicrorhabdus sp.]
MQLKCILFDLDGTLLDTSFDFSYALNQTCSDFEQPRLNYQDIRKTVSQGGLAMTKLAFPQLDGEELEQRRQHFLKIYFDNIDRHTRLFPGLETGMQALAQKSIPWGIITNKPTWLTERLLQSIQFPSEPKTIVCGDTLDVRKPHPQPMWLAAEACGFPPEECLYIGDHPRDIEAGINAGMQTAAAWYGYLPETASQSDWPANLHFGTPYELSRFLIDLAEQ